MAITLYDVNDMDQATGLDNCAVMWIMAVAL